MKHELHQAADSANQAVGWILNAQFCNEHRIDPRSDIERARERLTDALHRLAVLEASFKGAA